jgi:hypothetical protein
MQLASRTFSARVQLLRMAFAQLTFRESLRDVEVCLHSQRRLFYSMGIRGRVPRTKLAYAKENGDWRGYFELARALVCKARKLYRNDTYIEKIDEIVYALDAATIDLCMSLLPWARFPQEHGIARQGALLVNLVTNQIHHQLKGLAFPRTPGQRVMQAAT